MALTRKFLSAMGIEADKIDEIITAHSETVEGLKAERDKYKKDADKLPTVQAEFDKLKADADANTPYKEKYEKEHQDFEAFKNEQTEKETKAKKTEAYTALLKEAGVSEKHLNAVLKVTDLSTIELDKDGKIKDADKATESIKNEWSDFIGTPAQKGADTPTPPGGNGENQSHHGSGRAKELEKQYHENLYGPTNNGGKE